MYNGVGEWNGPWSDGSKEWTPYWLKKLNHRFGDDGIFWMSYHDMLDTFRFLHRTRLFGDKWTVVQRWTSVNVGWGTGYPKKNFHFCIKKAGICLIVCTPFFPPPPPPPSFLPPLFHISQLGAPPSNNPRTSSTSATSKASKANTTSSCTSSSRSPPAPPASTSAASGPCTPGSRGR